MDNFNIEKVPSWFQTTECLWCQKEMHLYCIRELTEVIQGWYVCKNKECEYVKRFIKNSIQGIEYTERYPEAYRQYIEKEKEEALKRPDDREVAMEVKLEEEVK